MGLGQNIKKIREQSGLTQKELGKIADVSFMAVSQWENDRAVPRMGSIQKIADYFNIPKSEILDQGAQAKLEKNKAEAYLPLIKNPVQTNKNETECDEKIEVPQSVYNNHQKAYFIENKSDFINKICPTNCLLLIDKKAQVSNGSLVAITINRKDYTVGRYYQGATTIIISPESYNEELEDVLITNKESTDTHILGTVVWYQPANELV